MAARGCCCETDAEATELKLPPLGSELGPGVVCAALSDADDQVAVAAIDPPSSAADDDRDPDNVQRLHVDDGLMHQPDNVAEVGADGRDAVQHTR
jgi:hypothetical protein